jgi:hypothetical protein
MLAMAERLRQYKPHHDCDCWPHVREAADMFAALAQGKPQAVASAEPVAWRSHHKELGGDQNDPNSWSLCLPKFAPKGNVEHYTWEPLCLYPPEPAPLSVPREIAVHFRELVFMAKEWMKYTGSDTMCPEPYEAALNAAPAIASIISEATGPVTHAYANAAIRKAAAATVPQGAEIDALIDKINGARARFGLPGFHHAEGEPHSQFVFDVLGEARAALARLRPADETLVGQPIDTVENWREYAASLPGDARKPFIDFLAAADPGDGDHAERAIAVVGHDGAKITIGHLRVLRDAEDGWRTMDSAPKDGTRILVYQDKEDDDLVPQIAMWSEHAGCWVLAWDHERFDGDNWEVPSHWRPLPAPPVTYSPHEVKL